MNKINPNDPAIPIMQADSYGSVHLGISARGEDIWASTFSGPSLRTKAIFDCITALMGNTEWYGYNGDDATINEAIE